MAKIWPYDYTGGEGGVNEMLTVSCWQLTKIVGGGGMSKSGANLNLFAPLKHGSSDWEDQIQEQNINQGQKTPWKI